MYNPLLLRFSCSAMSRFRSQIGTQMPIPNYDPNCGRRQFRDQIPKPLKRNVVYEVAVAIPRRHAMVAAQMWGSVWIWTFIHAGRVLLCATKNAR